LESRNEWSKEEKGRENETSTCVNKHLGFCECTPTEDTLHGLSLIKEVRKKKKKKSESTLRY
jgi:hypothetical protein